MPAFTATTTPQLLFHCAIGDTGRPAQVGIQLAPAATGNVFIAKNQTKAVAGSTIYVNENTSMFSVELKAGQEIWVVTSSGSVNLVWETFGAG